jgi:hypothetical protein
MVKDTPDMDRRVIPRPTSDRRKRPYGLVGVLALAVGLLVAGNLFALRTEAVFAADAGGFIVFVNAIGLLAMTSIAVGAVIRWRVPQHPIGPLLMGGALLLMSVFVAWPLVLTTDAARLSPLLTGLVAWWATLGLVPALFLLFPAVGLVFPDGRLPGPRWRRPYVAVIALLIVGIVLQTIAPWERIPEMPIGNPLALPGLTTTVSLALFLGFALAVTAIVVRFRRSTGTERAQMKWLVAALALMAIVFPVSFATDVGPAGLIDLASVLVGVLVPLAIGIAILRYRLFDIDRIISRTIGWAIVTGSLAAVFLVGVVALQSLFADVVQGGGTLAVAASTLVAYALFQPVRRRVQKAVDRRFDRAHYDTERTAAAFADRLRHDADLDTVTDELRTVVGQAVRPTASGIWLHETSRR